MSAHAPRVLSTSVDGRPLDIRSATLLARYAGRGPRAWELTGWMEPAENGIRNWLVADASVQVVIETTAGMISGAATISLMAFADATGSRTMVRIWSTARPRARPS